MRCAPTDRRVCETFRWYLRAGIKDSTETGKPANGNQLALSRPNSENPVPALRSWPLRRRLRVRPQSSRSRMFQESISMMRVKGPIFVVDRAGFHRFSMAIEETAVAPSVMSGDRAMRHIVLVSPADAKHVPLPVKPRDCDKKRGRGRPLESALTTRDGGPWRLPQARNDSRNVSGLVPLPRVGYKAPLKPR